MFELPVTKDSYKLLCIIYHEFVLRHEKQSKTTSAYFDNIPNKAANHIPEEDLYSCICELNSNGFVRKYVDGGFMLTDKAIVFMENRFKTGISEIVDVISNFM